MLNVFKEHQQFVHSNSEHLLPQDPPQPMEEEVEEDKVEKEKLEEEEVQEEEVEEDEVEEEEVGDKDVPPMPITGLLRVQAVLTLKT